jgi:hypothetical protein
LVDIFNNRIFKNKTVLTIGAPVWGAIDNWMESQRLASFGNHSPNSLFFYQRPGGDRLCDVRFWLRRAACRMARMTT